MLPNPLLAGIETARQRIDILKSRAREFYFAVLLSLHPCPKCGGQMHMSGPSRCACQCGTILDPTVAFQRSQCCGASMVKRRYHYACSRCGTTEPSKFLFDERVFNPEYFREKMREHRERRQRRLDAMKRLLTESRSGEWLPSDLDVPDELSRELDESIGNMVRLPIQQFVAGDAFSLEQYRQIILESVADCDVWFNALPSISANPRLDKARRFMTLLFMENSREVWLEQHGEDILVKHYEAYD